MLLIGIAHLLLMIYAIQLAIMANFELKPRPRPSIGWALALCFAALVARLIHLFWQFRKPEIGGSIIDSRFECGIIGDVRVDDIKAIQPSARGRAWITGRHPIMLEPDSSPGWLSPRRYLASEIMSSNRTS
ncbi:MAG: proline racemase family protein [Gammaproteobacteria bacterium]|nr:proline racemase family protein [Gammaproteobacteria bacterium]MDH3449555.1 proline racemase family protein [Gammaproteobacteria bacterium]